MKKSMKKRLRVNLLFVFLIICSCATFVFANGVKDSERVAGIWVVDKDKMQQEGKKLLKLARAKVKELNTELAEKQLEGFEGINKKHIEMSERRLFHLNADGSGGIFPNLIGLQGMRAPLGGPSSLLFWQIEGETISLFQYYRPYGYKEESKSTLSFEGDNLVLHPDKSAYEVKPNETNLLLLFRFKKYYFKKVDPNDPIAQKPKILSLKAVQLEAPDVFEVSKIRYTTGYPEEIKDYVNQSNQEEKITLRLTGDYELGYYNRPGGEKADHDKIITILTEGLHDKLKKKFPDASLSTKFCTLDETKTGYLEGVLTDNYKTPLYTKHYILVDDGVGVLDIAITAESLKRISFMDDYVKGIELNMNRTWTVPMEAVMEAKRKTEEYMKKKSSESSNLVN